MWRTRLMAVMLLCALSGCSVWGRFSEGYLQSNVALYEAQPAAVQQSYPQFIQRIYFTSSLLVNPPEQWRLRLLSPSPLQLPARIPLVLRYRLDEETTEYQSEWQQVPAQTASADTADTAETGKPPYIYLLQPADNISQTAFWQGYQERLWQSDKPRFDFMLQPELAGPTDQIAIEYQLAGHGGFLSAGDFARKLFVGSERVLADLCEQSDYRYRKTSACGQVVVQELPAEPPASAEASASASRAMSRQRP